MEKKKLPKEANSISFYTKNKIKEIKVNVEESW